VAQSISGSVGQGGKNNLDDVKVVQSLLNSVPPAQGGASPRLVTDGKAGSKTVQAISRFQTNQLGHSDGRVDPGKTTFNKLVALAGPDGNFQGFSADQIAVLKKDLDRAISMIDNAVSLMQLAPFLNPGLRTKNVVDFIAFNFGIDFSDKTNPINLALQSALLVQLIGRFNSLRATLNASLPFVAEPGAEGALAADAFVLGTTDPTIHIKPQYFDKPGDERSAILVHEHAHTKFKSVGHPGIGGTGQDLLIVEPEDDKRGLFQPPGHFLDQALQNPFCYEWLIRALDKRASAKVFSGSCQCLTKA